MTLETVTAKFTSTKSATMTETTTKPKAATDLPPGTVLGPDGRPCKVCIGSDWKTWSNPSKMKAGASTSKTTSESSSASSASALASGAGFGAAALATNASRPQSITPSPTHPYYAQCPLNGPELGRATWSFLHTSAAYYPTAPSPAHKRSMRSLLTSLPFTYPCSHCADHFGEELKVHPVDEKVLESRFNLSRWLCERHNEVNERLGKDRFDCARTDERWYEGPADGSCD